MDKMSHEIASETRLTYSEEIAKDDFHYINLTKDLSWLNSRGHDVTDREGHVVGYWCDVTIVLDSAADWLLGTAPNTWKLRNAFRKFHFAREEMFRNAGVTKKEMGRYGRSIRPYLEQNMVDYTDLANPKESNVLVPIGCTDAQREWTYTNLGASPGWETTSTGPGGLSLVDEFQLTILDENKVEATSSSGGVTTKFSTAGMIHSYNIDRMEVITPGAEEVIDGPNNPLANVRAQSPSAGQVTEIAEDQELEAPPYDIRDNGDSVKKIIVDYANTNNATLQVVRMRNVFVPGGILAFNQGSDAAVTPAILIDVKGWSYCKDLA